MIYYPKSHITPSLYSNGELAFKETNTPYTGYYFSTLDNKNFTGRFPGDGNNQELISVTNQIDYCEKENIIMDNLRQKSVNGVTRKYNWDFVVSEYLEVFNSLLNQRN